MQNINAGTLVYFVPHFLSTLLNYSRPKREYFAPVGGEGETPHADTGTNSPPEPEDDYVSDEPLPSMAMGPDQTSSTMRNNTDNKTSDDRESSATTRTSEGGTETSSSVGESSGDSTTTSATTTTTRRDEPFSGPTPSKLRKADDNGSFDNG